MRDGKTVSIRYSDDELNRLEQAAAIAGYPKLSPYLRDKTLDKIGQHHNGRDELDAWAERQEVSTRLADIARTQHAANAMLTTLVYLVHRKATVSDMTDLRAAVAHAGLSHSTLDKIVPELGKLIQQLQPE